MGTMTRVATTAELQPGQSKRVEVDGEPVAVFNIGGKFYAIHDTCVHRGGPLNEGTIEGTVVTCPWHGWEYDVAAGKCVTNPSAKIACYTVKVQGADIVVES